jgi:hypothetical protein
MTSTTNSPKLSVQMQSLAHFEAMDASREDGLGDTSEVLSFTHGKWHCSITKTESLQPHPYEWHVSKGTTIIHDPTSWSDADGAVLEAKRVADHYTSHPHSKELRFHKPHLKK